MQVASSVSVEKDLVLEALDKLEVAGQRGEARYLKDRLLRLPAGEQASLEWEAFLEKLRTAATPVKG